MSLAVYDGHRCTCGNLFNISFKSGSDTVASIKIFNTLGEEVYSKQNISLGKGANSYSVTHNLPAGVYILKAVINSAYGQQTVIAKKVLIMK
ncbi:MAG: T9SS type A sorting domain-containing protein [Ignavibacteria bacterium]|nr:T9SS type A sorting domain-containing protein [Ignavibacteria bacterium]